MSYEIHEIGTGTLNKVSPGEQASVVVAHNNDITISKYDEGETPLKINSDYVENECLIAQKINTDKTFNLTKVALNITKASDDFDEKEFTVKFCADNTTPGTPGEVLSEKTFTLADLPEVAGWTELEMDDDEIESTGGTDYWLVVELPELPAENAYSILGDNSGSDLLEILDGSSTWAAVSDRTIHYKLISIVEDEVELVADGTEADLTLTSDDSTVWHAFSFASGDNTELNSVTLKSRGASLEEGTTGDVVIELYSDSDEPNESQAVLDTIAVGDFPASGEDIEITGLTETITASTTYWIVIKAPQTVEGDSISIQKIDGITAKKTLDEGSDWSDADNTGILHTIEMNLTTVEEEYDTGDTGIEKQGIVEDDDRSVAFAINAQEARNLKWLRIVSGGSTGTISGDMRVSLFTENGGEPNEEVAGSEETFDLGDYPDSGELIEIKYTGGLSITKDEDYFVVVKVPAQTGEVRLMSGTTTDEIQTLLEGGSWSVVAATSLNHELLGHVQMDVTDDKLFITKYSKRPYSLHKPVNYGLYVEKSNGSFTVKASEKGLPEDINFNYIIVSETETE